MARAGEVCRGQAVMLVRLVRPVRKHKRIRWAPPAPSSDIWYCWSDGVSCLDSVCISPSCAPSLTPSPWISSPSSPGPSSVWPTLLSPVSRPSSRTPPSHAAPGSGQCLSKILTLTLTLTLSRYWVVLGVFSLVELLLDLAINPLAYSFPAYLILKCAFLAWCMAPVEWNGSDVIFNNVSDSYPSI